MTHDTNKHALPVHHARALWRHASDPRAHAALGLLLLTGLRPGEVEVATVRDYLPDVPQLRVGPRYRMRTIAIAPSAAEALDGYLTTRCTHPEDSLLVEARTTRLVKLVHDVSRQAGVMAGVHDLRHAAIAAVVEDGTPIRHVNAYFGFLPEVQRWTDPPLGDGWDTDVAGSLETAFAR